MDWLTIDAGEYIAKIADTKSELEGAFKLRHDELVLAYNNNANVGELDVSTYDDYSKILIVKEKATDEVVACMRMTDCSKLPNDLPLICEDEFDVSEIKQTGEKICEASRAVVKTSHRNGSVLMLLFKLIGRYALSSFRYLIGDVSFFGTDKMQYVNEFSLIANKYALTEFNVKSLDRDQIELLPAEKTPSEKELQHTLPPLVRLYAMIGAKFSTEAFSDYPFGSVDLFVLFDTQNCNKPVVEKMMR